jgi:hypothetical protein
VSEDCWSVGRLSERPSLPSWPHGSLWDPCRLPPISSSPLEVSPQRAGGMGISRAHVGALRAPRGLLKTTHMGSRPRATLGRWGGRLGCPRISPRADGQGQGDLEPPYKEESLLSLNTHQLLPFVGWLSALSLSCVESLPSWRFSRVKVLHIHFHLRYYFGTIWSMVTKFYWNGEH